MYREGLWLDKKFHIFATKTLRKNMGNIFLTRDQLASFEQPKNRLEPEYAASYEKWKEKPGDQSNVDAMLGHMTPLIERNVRTIGGGAPTYLRTQGKLLAMRSLPKYDPTKGSMATFLNQQLMPLRRTSRQQMNLLGVPDRLMLANQHMSSAQTELADRLNISVKQIKRLQGMGHARNTGGYADQQGDEDGGATSPEVRRRLNDEYVNQYVLSDLDEVSATIFKHDNQLSGMRRLSTDALARKPVRFCPFVDKNRLIKWASGAVRVLRSFLYLACRLPRRINEILKTTSICTTIAIGLTASG